MTVTLLLFFAVLIVTVVLFAGWVVVTGTRSAWRLVSGWTGSPLAAMAGVPRCRTAGCRVENPTAARFCRRCGSTLGQPMTAAARASLARLRTFA